MKRISILPFCMFLFACGNTPQSKEAELDTVIEESIVKEIEKDMEETDATTAATAKNNEVSFNGTIVIPPQRLATVTLTLGGVIKSTTLLPGQYIQRGAVLATLENPEFIELQQGWLESKAQLEYLETEYERQKTLSAEQAASKKKLQQSKAEYLSMKSRMEASAAQLSLLNVSVNDLEKGGIQPLLQVKAPISGYVGTVDINIGKYINPGDQLCDIIDKSQAMLKLTVYEKDLIGLQANMPVEFHINGKNNQAFEATIISIGQKVDEVSRSVEVYARVSETQQEFRPGMYVRAHLKK